jgi:hypothetical protein
MPRPIHATAVALLALPLVALAPAPAAAAEPVQLGSLYVDPPTGADDTPLTLLTSGGCPAPATNVVARVTGPGFPSAGQIVVGNTDAGVARSGSFSVVPGDTLRSFAALQPTPALLRGTYRVVVSCQEALGSTSLGDYVGTLVFASPASYAARNPAAKPVPVAPEQLGPALPTGGPASPPALAGPGQTSGQQSAGTSSSGQEQADAGGDTTPGASAGVDDDRSLAPLLAAGLGGAALAVVVLGISRLTRRSAVA